MFVSVVSETQFRFRNEQMADRFAKMLPVVLFVTFYIRSRF